MEKKWWHDKVVYQIYPKSFCDTNGDGIGDLPGIISKLDYLKDLGVDIIWLSPCYKSPFADQGYDISDYYAIDEQFGSMEDMDTLIAEAKKRGMYILMDLVVNHCSDEHEWFKKACEDPDGEYGKYFYLRDKGEELPTNWRSYFGGPVWDDLPGTNKQYLHVFHKKQPDLNWENPKVREEVYKNINWWLDKGLGGFRIDAIINIKKPAVLKNYEPDREDGLSSVMNMLADAEGLGEFLNEMKEETFKKYDAFTVGEVCDKNGVDTASFIGSDGYFSSMFDFNETVFGMSDKGWYDRIDITPDDYKRCCFETQRNVSDIGFVSNIIENHDEPRGVSHYLPEGEIFDASKKMLAGLNMMLKGIPFIYQGQEIGMENTKFSSIDEIDDVSTIGQYQIALNDGLSEEEALAAVAKWSRDNARTPMQWSDEKNAGFSTGNPWQKVNPNYVDINVASQIDDEDSVLSFYKKITQLRKMPEYKETIVYGEFVPVFEDVHNLMAYYRKGEKTLLVIGNYQMEEMDIELSEEFDKVLINNYKELKSEGKKLHLLPYQYLVLDIK